MVLPAAFPDSASLQLPLVIFVATILIVLALFAISRLSIEQRLANYTYARLAGTPTDATAPFSQRVSVPLVRQLGNVVRSISKAQVEGDVRQKLAQAGSPLNLHVTSFLALRGAGLLLPP